MQRFLTSHDPNNAYGPIEVPQLIKFKPWKERRNITYGRVQLSFLQGVWSDGRSKQRNDPPKIMKLELRSFNIDWAHRELWFTTKQPMLPPATYVFLAERFDAYARYATARETGADPLAALTTIEDHPGFSVEDHGLLTAIIHDGGSPTDATAFDRFIELYVDPTEAPPR